MRNYEDEFGNEVEEHTIIVKKPHGADKKSNKGGASIKAHKDLHGKSGDVTKYRNSGAGKNMGKNKKNMEY